MTGKARSEPAKASSRKRAELERRSLASEELSWPTRHLIGHIDVLRLWDSPLRYPVLAHMRLPSVIRVSPAHRFPINCLITAQLYVVLVIIGSIWGIFSLYAYFKIEVALRGQGSGPVAAVFLPSFLSPWGAVAAWTALETLDGWIDVLSPGRDDETDF